MGNFLILISCAVLFICGCSCKEPVSYTIEENAVLLDVRTSEEYQQKHIEGAVNLPLADIDSTAAKIIHDKNTPIYIYCRSGRRSKYAQDKLIKQGYVKVIDFGSMGNAEKMLNLP